jgi:hypothetical protein
MKYISHRGNLFGSNPETENSPAQIEKALSLEFDVEIDLYVIDNKLLLGHDYGQYEVDYSFITQPGLWIHAKNLAALEYLSNLYVQTHYFWHQNDDLTLTSRNVIWTFPGKPLASNAIAVMPETVLALEDIVKLQCGGFCSDIIADIRKGYDKIRKLCYST